jgi:hypothetical protein
VRRALFAVEERRLDLAVGHDPLAQPQRRVGEQPLRRRSGHKAAGNGMICKIGALNGCRHDHPLLPAKSIRQAD